MKTIIKVISVSKRVGVRGPFYLSVVELDDGESYSLAHSRPPRPGDKVESWFDETYNKPKAAYPKH